ncbi:MAG TPA: hypothetical protein VE225_07120, partial [Rubrobacteraceae bacterium]|nr:hypothetical protein [Rubrobacteraceae bacterium]
MAGQHFHQYEIPKSRRELRRERQRKAGGFLGFLARQAPGQKAPEARFREEHEVPKSRRQLHREPRERRKRKWRGGLRELLVTVLIALVVVFGVVRPFVVEAFRIP